ncbi:hypothetical protein Hanom_Chr02g00132571 [Helianthus anomalus]
MTDDVRFTFGDISGLGSQIGLGKLSEGSGQIRLDTSQLSQRKPVKSVGWGQPVRVKRLDQDGSVRGSGSLGQTESTRSTWSTQRVNPVNSVDPVNSVNLFGVSTLEIGKDLAARFNCVISYIVSAIT